MSTKKFPFKKKSLGAFRLGALFWVGLISLLILSTHVYRKYVIHQGLDPAEFSQLKAAEQDNNLAITDQNPPEWKILVLVYDRVRFDYIDKYGVEHRFRSMMTAEEISRIEPAVKRFFHDELPIMSSGAVRAKVTIKYIKSALSELSEGCGLYPGPSTTSQDVDLGYDSVIVFWDSSGVNEVNGRLENPQPRCGGLTPDVGAKTTYTTITIDGLPRTNHNIIKHEWGHSVLFYFAFIGKSPKPTVTNHIDRVSNVYVNCKTGQYYDLSDETYDKVLPNSIYNIYQGFTRDYYSGEVATPDNPSRCLGIPQSAWRFSPNSIRKSL